jgi:ribonucleoside-triphosphate reductase (thioredoxin)
MDLMISSFVRPLYREKYLDTIKEMKIVGKEKVYDVSVKDVHEFDGNGLRLHNCEILLKPFQMCNLVEINASDLEGQQDFEDRVKAATILGTLQASYTDFHYLRPIWRKTTEKEALLGIGMTGIASGKVLELDMTKASAIALQENERFAKLLGINKAARLTCIKPSGTTSCVLGTSSGIHAWHAKFYLRRMRVGKNEAIYSYLLKNHPEILEDDYFRPHDTAIIALPQRAPEGAITRDESALDLLARVKKVSLEWVIPGSRPGKERHNVSATITIDKNEWKEVGEWMWNNKETYSGLSVLPKDYGSYIQPPFEDITEEKYHELFARLHEVNLDNVVEIEDETDLKGEVACAGGACILT